MQSLARPFTGRQSKRINIEIVNPYVALSKRRMELHQKP
ncbi:unnamed protein product [Acidithrix sp. C25]|nr:unnamed protein product [Acidithrix sp. C25]